MSLETPEAAREKCCACSRNFAAGDTVITFYFQQVMRGEKSGVLGFYDHKNSPDGSVDYVHFSYACLEKCFSPMENPFMYDILADAVRKEIYDDEAGNDDDDMPEITVEEDPPYCLWCKKEEAVWVHYQRDMHIYNCMQCSKLWDDEERELLWDPQRGYLRAA